VCTSVKRIPPNHFNIKISKKALCCFDRYSWPGNIRELRHTVDRIATTITNSMIKPKDLPSELFKPLGGNTMHLKEALDDFERQYIRDILQQTKGNQVKAAKILKVDPKTLWAKIKKLELAPKQHLDSFLC